MAHVKVTLDGRAVATYPINHAGYVGPSGTTPATRDELIAEAQRLVIEDKLLDADLAALATYQVDD